MAHGKHPPSVICGTLMWLWQCTRVQSAVISKHVTGRGPVLLVEGEVLISCDDREYFRAFESRNASNWWANTVFVLSGERRMPLSLL